MAGLVPGDAFGVSPALLTEPQGHVNGGAISGTIAFQGASRAGQGVTPGRYVAFALGQVDWIDVESHPVPSPVPLPAAAPTTPAGLAQRRRRG